MVGADVRPEGSGRTSNGTFDTMNAVSRRFASQIAWEDMIKSAADLVAPLGHSSAIVPDYELRLNAGQSDI